jgi:hypothetical protein
VASSESTVIGRPGEGKPRAGRHDRGSMDLFADKVISELAG